MARARRNTRDAEETLASSDRTGREDRRGIRSTREVLEDHLRQRRGGNLEADLRRNYAQDVVLMTENSILEGQNAIRYSAGRLRSQLTRGNYEYVALQVHGEYGLLVWRAPYDGDNVSCGADSFVVRGGRIVLQTVHYCFFSRPTSD